MAYNRNDPWIKRVFRGKNWVVLVATALAFISMNVYRMNDPLPVGTQVEDFKLTNIDGVTFNISDMKVPTVIIFYENKNYFGNFAYNKKYEKSLGEFKFLQDNNIAHIIVIIKDCDNVSKLAELANSRDTAILKSVGYSSDDKKIAKYFGVRSYPHLFLLNSNGVVIFETKLASPEYIKNMLWRN